MESGEGTADRGKHQESRLQNERSSLVSENSELEVTYGGISSSFPENSGIYNYRQMNCPENFNSSPDEQLKRRLKYFFMNPIEKWRMKGKFPWKLVLQVIKIIFVTVQLCIFGTDGYTFEVQKQNTGFSFRHMFLAGWTPLRDIVSYPPSTGPYAVYTKADFYGNINHVIKTYANLTQVSLGTYCYDGDNCTMDGLSFCRKEFKMMVTFNSSVNFDGHPREICHRIPRLYPAGAKEWKKFSIKDFLATQNDSIAFNQLISAEISFYLKTIFLKSIGNNKFPDCYRFLVRIQYNNNEHDGQVLVVLETSTEKLKCSQSNNVESEDRLGYAARQILNSFIIGICVLSLLLCLRMLAKARSLCALADSYFQHSQGKGLSFQEKLEFVDMWYCMMIFNDILIITASILKTAIEQRTVESDQYATCAILLGAGNLLVWAGVLRYLGFFSKYNILILTMKRAIPNVLRFTLCCVLLYLGFTFCGWLVLGPYHIKFRSLSSTSECLFAMMNGDDLFATFAILSTGDSLIWWFSRVYLYTFISMFIYVVISLFISVIMDSYETVKDYYQLGVASGLSRVRALVVEYPDDSCASFYQQRRRDRRSTWQRILGWFCKWRTHT